LIRCRLWTGRGWPKVNVIFVFGPDGMLFPELGEINTDVDKPSLTGLK